MNIANQEGLSLDWYSTIELKPGVWTRSDDQPPYWTMSLAREALRNTDLKDRKCLDVGAVDGLISTLLCRMGAGRVVATDCCDYSKQIQRVQGAYGVDFEYIHPVGTLELVDRMLSLHKFGQRLSIEHDRQRHDQDFGFDLVVCSGVMYHVHSPMHLMGSLRTLVRPGGLVFLETAILPDKGDYMQYNHLVDQHYIYAVSDTWFLTPNLLDTLLRTFSLKPIDFIYRDQKAIDGERRVGRGVVVCRAMDTVPSRECETQMAMSTLNFEFDSLYRRDLESLKGRTHIDYGKPISNQHIDSQGFLNLLAACNSMASLPIDYEIAKLKLTDEN